MSVPWLGLHSTIPFGKYDGQMISQVMKDDLKYIEWAYRNTVFVFMNDALKVLHELGVELRPDELRELKEKELI